MVTRLMAFIAVFGVAGAFACYEKTTVVQQSTALGAETLR